MPTHYGIAFIVLARIQAMLCIRLLATFNQPPYLIVSK